MAENKRYYWLKIEDSFFESKEIKFLRRYAGGDTLVIIYLKMMVLSLESGGKLYFDGIGESLEEELSIELDEDIKNIQMVLGYLQSKKLMSTEEESKGFFLEQVPEMVGSETESAKIKRRQRAREIEQVDNVRELSEPVQKSPLISESEKESESEKDIESESESESEKGHIQESEFESSDKDLDLEFRKVCDFYKNEIGKMPKDKDKKNEHKLKELLKVFDSKEVCDAFKTAKEYRARSKIAYAINILENKMKDRQKRVKGVPEWSNENYKPEPITPEKLLELFILLIGSSKDFSNETKPTLEEVKAFQAENVLNTGNVSIFLEWRNSLSPMERARVGWKGKQGDKK